MTTFERLLEEAKRRDLTVKEVDFHFVDGLIKGRRIGIRKSIETSAGKADVLAEEIAHWETTTGNILDQSKPENRKQERIARSMAYDLRIGLDGIVRAWEYGCQNTYEAAEYLGTRQSFLEEAIDYYHQKYGICTEFEEYTIIFDPALMVIKNN